MGASIDVALTARYALIRVAYLCDNFAWSTELNLLMEGLNKVQLQGAKLFRFAVAHALSDNRAEGFRRQDNPTGCSRTHARFSVPSGAPALISRPYPRTTKMMAKD